MKTKKYNKQGKLDKPIIGRIPVGPPTKVIDVPKKGKGSYTRKKKHK